MYADKQQFHRIHPDLGVKQATILLICTARYAYEVEKFTNLYRWK